MKEKNIKEKTQQKKKMGLTTKIFVALIAGAILGIILCYLVPDSSFKKDVIVEAKEYIRQNYNQNITLNDISKQFFINPYYFSQLFKKKTGMAVGISAAFSGLVGMIGSSFLGMAIPAFGWRVSYVAVGIVSTALVLPISLFILRYKPEEMGLLPYGAENVEQRAVSGTSAPASVENGTPIKELLRQPEFYIAVGAYWTSVSCAYLNSFLTPCGIAAGLTLQAAAMMTSISLLGNMSSKLILGKISDSLGIIRTFEVSIALAFLGHVLLFVGSPETVMAGSLFYGVTLPLSSVMMPLFCRIFWKEISFRSYFRLVMTQTLILIISMQMMQHVRSQKQYMQKNLYSSLILKGYTKTKMIRTH